MDAQFETVDVFAETRFAGNQLAVITDARDMDSATMQSIAREFNFSETTFVLPPANPANTARVRIFTTQHEMAFAGHPLVGTALVLHRAGTSDAMRIEVPAGIVDVSVSEESGAPRATITAPLPLSLGVQPDPALVARCVGLEPQRLIVDNHRPISASMGTSFVIAEVASDALADVTPQPEAFARLAHEGERAILIYTCDGDDVRCRMFWGLWEDAATGSANTPLAGLLLFLRPDHDELTLTSRQGIEMGRPSRLDLRAWRTTEGIRASVGGTAIPVTSGTVRF